MRRRQRQRDPLQPVRQRRDRDNRRSRAAAAGRSCSRRAPPRRAPCCSTSPEATSPIDQLVRIRLTKKAATAKPSPQKLKPKKSDRHEGHRHHADQHAHDAHHHQRGDSSAGRSGVIIRLPRLRDHISSRNEMREADLAAEEDVPEQHRADEGAAGLARACPIARRQIELQEAPHQHLHRRPVDEVDDARPGIAQQIPVAQHHRADAARGRRMRRVDGGAHSRRLPSRRSRATSRKTSSIVSRP